jgi:hypothetical protein
MSLLERCNGHYLILELTIANNINGRHHNNEALSNRLIITIVIHFVDLNSKTFNHVCLAGHHGFGCWHV